MGILRVYTLQTWRCPLTFEKIGEFVVLSTIALALMCFFSLVLALPTMLLWNAVVPELFGFKSINWIEALYLCLLGRLLLGASGSKSSSKKD